MLRLTWLPFAVAAQLLLLVGVWRSGGGAPAAVMLLLASLLTFYFLRALWRHKSAILDTPTSRVASAAKGYVELTGRAEQDPGTPLHSKLTGLPCLWFEYRVEARRHDRWTLIDSGRSQARFRLRDESGTCLIDPTGADVLPRKRDRWVKDGYRYTEALLMQGDPVYTLGWLTIEGGLAHAPPQRTVQTALLKQWKSDQSTLLTRFDLDGSGHLDETEWDLARRAAHREAGAQADVQRAQRGDLLLCRPTDGRPFVVGSGTPALLARRYVRWFRVQATLLIITGIYWALWLYQMGVR